MMIRDTAAKSGKPDLISQGVGSPHYIQPWYPDDLTLKVLGKLAKEPIRISRFYFNEGVRTAVDFEPDPRDERFYLDEKREWCMSQGIAYVPIFLSDQLTLDQFAERVQEARRLLKRGRTELRDRKTLDAGAPDVALLQIPEVALYVDREALRRLEEGLAAGKNWRGAARDTALARFKKRVISEILEKYPRGDVGPEYRETVTSHAAGG